MTLCENFEISCKGSNTSVTDILGANSRPGFDGQDGQPGEPGRDGSAGSPGRDGTIGTPGRIWAILLHIF